ncbi:MAG TPA: hypothetical protein VMG38_10100 [Trebonia sp.]|nr:hypothetical protein [Trebonia sp.]
MTAHPDVRAAGERVETLIAELRAQCGPRTAATAEELVSCLVELYGAALGRVTGLLGRDEAGSRLLAELAADPLVEGLLLVHDLHPLDTRARVLLAIERLRLPATVSYLGLSDEGAVRLRLERGGHGCQSSAAQVTTAITEAVAAAAPETAGVEVDDATPPPGLPLLQISRRPAVAG